MNGAAEQIMYLCICAAGERTPNYIVRPDEDVYGALFNAQPSLLVFAIPIDTGSEGWEGIHVFRVRFGGRSMCKKRHIVPI